MSTSRWSTIESSPEVFTELIERFGVTGLQVEELYALDQLPDLSVTNGKNHGLIFLFKWVGERDDRAVSLDVNTEDLFFAKQVVQNACASQAILSILMNADDVDLGEQLNDLKAFTLQLDSESRGIALGNHDGVRQAHNAFAKPDPFVHDDEDDKKSKSREKEDAYHFIAYVPFRGCVYELDGLKAGPIKLGDVSAGQEWWTIARPAIEARISRYSQSETSFNLMCVCQSRLSIINSEMTDILSRLSSSSAADQQNAPELHSKLESLQAEVADETSRLERQRAENVRRRHNFIPFILTLLNALAAKGDAIPALVTKAQERKRARLLSAAAAAGK